MQFDLQVEVSLHPVTSLLCEENFVAGCGSQEYRADTTHD